MRMKRRKQRKEIDVSYITEIYEKRKARRQIASVPMGLGIFDSSSVPSEQSIIPFFFLPIILLTCWVAYRKVRKGDAQVMAILRVEGGVVNEIYAAADHVAGGESRSVGLPGATWAETVAVVAVVTVWMLIPTGKSIYVDAWGREADAHVTVSSLAHNLHLEVVQAAGSRYRVRCANTGSVFVGFAVTWKKNTSPTLFKGIGKSDEYRYSVIRKFWLQGETY